LSQGPAGVPFTDQEAYCEIKDPVFDIIMEGANDWAENTNWSEPPGD